MKQPENMAAIERQGVEFSKDRNGVDQVLLRNNFGASARVSLHGGQVLSWKTYHGEELLFTSRKAVFKPPTPVRGGIPICFPEFRNQDQGTIEQHGFARNKMWVIDDNPPPLNPNDSDRKSSIDLLLKPSQEDLRVWPHSFKFRLRVTLTAYGFLNMVSRIRNVDSKPFSFSFAYHTYLKVSDISEVRIEGLETLHYLDNLKDRERFTDQGDAITFESEVDRIYLESTEKTAVLDHGIRRTIFIQREGLPDVLVWNPWDRRSWNPWDKRAKALPDFGNEEYQKMLCVDGAVLEKPITLKPGEEWTGRLELSFVNSTLKNC